MPKILIALSIFALGILAVLNAIEGNELDREQSRYCDMVKIYKVTNGERGWPDYNKNAKEVCK